MFRPYQVKTVFCFLEQANGQVFSESHLKGFRMIKKMISENGGIVCQDLDEVANYLNDYQRNKEKIK